MDGHPHVAEKLIIFTISNISSWAFIDIPFFCGKLVVEYAFLGKEQILWNL